MDLLLGILDGRDKSYSTRGTQTNEEGKRPFALKKIARSGRADDELGTTTRDSLLRQSERTSVGEAKKKVRFCGTTPPWCGKCRKDSPFWRSKQQPLKMKRLHTTDDGSFKGSEKVVGGTISKKFL